MKKENKPFVQSSSVKDDDADERLYDLIAQLSFRGFLSDRISVKEATEKVKRFVQSSSVVNSAGVWSRHKLGEKYNQWLLDNNRKDGNYSNTVFDFWEWIETQSSCVKDDDGEVNMEDEHHHETGKVEHPNYFTSSVKDEDKKVTGHSERINYVIEDNYYCGYAVNLPIVVQADSLEDMKRRIKSTAQLWVNDVQKKIDNDQFDFVEEFHLKPLKDEVDKDSK